MLCVFAVVTTLPSRLLLPPPPPSASITDGFQKILQTGCQSLKITQFRSCGIGSPIAGTFEILLLYRYTVTSWRPLDDAVDRTTRHHVSRRLPRRHIDERSDLFSEHLKFVTV